MRQIQKNIIISFITNRLNPIQNSSTDKLSDFYGMSTCLRLFYA